MSDEFQNIFENLEETLERSYKENERICRTDELTVYLADSGAWYPIEFTQCDTHQKVLHWVGHLVTKSWVTKTHIKLFLSSVFARYPSLAPTGSIGE